MHAQTWAEAKLGLHEKTVNLVWKGFSFNTQWIHLTKYTCSFIFFIFSVMFIGYKLGQNTHTHTHTHTHKEQQIHPITEKKKKGTESQWTLYSFIWHVYKKSLFQPGDRMLIMWQSWAVLSTGPLLIWINNSLHSLKKLQNIPSQLNYILDI